VNQLTKKVTRVSHVELFFDLVFVFALSVATDVTAENLTARGLFQGLLVLALLWWAWVGFSWLGTNVHADQGRMVFAFLIAAGGILLVTILGKDWYAHDNAAIIAALAYTSVRVIQLVLYWQLGRDSPALRQATRRLAIGAGLGGVLLLTGAVVGGTAQIILVASAVLIDFGSALFKGGRGWDVSISHFAERYGLFIIIALGEVIIATGIASTSTVITVKVAIPILIAFVLTTAIWCAYFRAVSGPVEHALAAQPRERQPLLARDVYSYLHFVTLLGIFMMALTLKKTIAKVGDAGLDAHLYDVPAFALGVGVSLILVSLILMRVRVGVSVPRSAWVGLVVAIAFGAFAMTLPAIAVAGGMFVAIALSARRPPTAA
jgi:low temperature requirement protein LtrA